MNPARRALVAAAAAWAATGKASTPPLLLGIAPYLSPTALLAAFRPLREHLERDLAHPVATYTARDFRTMFDNTRRGDYDVAMLPAHVALVAIEDWHFTPLAATLPTTTTLLLVRKDSPIKGAADLQGGRLGGLDPLSIIVASALGWLQSQGLVPGRDLVFVPQASANSALFALDRGDIDVLAIASSQLLALPPETPRSDRVLQTVGHVRGPVYVARPGPPPDLLARWREAFTRFAPDPARPATAANTALQPLATADLAAIESYTPFARSLLGSGR